MNRKITITIVGLVILSALLIVFFIKPTQNTPPPPTTTTNNTATTEYVNDKYGFALTLDKDFENSVEIKEEGRTIYFVSRDIQAEQPDMIFGVIGRIEIYSKAESTKETMMEWGDDYGLSYLGENEAYYFGWAHATDVQIPPEDMSLEKEYRALEMKFEEIIKTFKTKETLPPEARIATGRYVGLADNNFFEVIISGMPDETTTKIFMISDKIRAKFEALNLQTGEEVKINYIQNEHGQNVVQEIEKMK